MKQFLNQKYFPFLVLVVFLGKSFVSPSFLDLSIVGIFAGVFLSLFYFEHREQLDHNKKVSQKIKELEERYDAKHKDMLKIIDELENDYNERVKVFEGKISGIDVFYKRQNSKEQLKRDIGWG